MRQNLQYLALSTSIFWLRQNLKQDKLTAWYRLLNVKGDLNLINLNQFKYTKNTKIGTTVLEFYNGDK